MLDDTPETIAEKVAAARVAQPAWAARPIAERIEILRAFRGWVVTQADELAATLTAETGKPITQSRNELTGLLPRIDFFLDEAERTLADEVVLDDADGGLREVIAHEPLGVIANISAWNYPYFVGSNVFVPALLAGNAVLYKPSEHATLTGLAIASMLERRRRADRRVQPGGRRRRGRRRAARATRSTACSSPAPTPPAVASPSRSRRSSTRVQLELGGKDPVYVCDDVDVAAAAEGLADGAFYNNGQSCCSVERIYVHDAVHDEFVERFVATVDGLRHGRPHRRRHLPRSAHPAEPRSTCSRPRWPTPSAKGATVRTGGAPGRRPPGARRLVRPDRAHRGHRRHGRHARRELRPDHRHPGGRRRRRGRRAA